MGTYDLQTYWKRLKVKVENHTKLANYENKQKSKTPKPQNPMSWFEIEYDFYMQESCVYEENGRGVTKQYHSQFIYNI